MNNKHAIASQRARATDRSDLQAEADAGQLAMLSQVLNEFCREHQIEAISERENAAALIKFLFQRGYETADDLNDALEMAGTIH
jgi:hypothetical protein